MERMRLNKYLAACGICSRREADRLIESGEVLIDGQRAEMGRTVDGSEEILVSGKAVKNTNKKVVLIYHKPAGVVCTEKDSHADRTIKTEIKYPIRVTYAGRLDKESTGLLILTNDGDLIEEMMRGANEHEKEYVVRVNKPIMLDDLRTMSRGLYLEELGVTTRPCKTRKMGERVFRIVLTQGLNRQIRRMCEAVGYRVVSLQRIRVANLRLGDLPEGQWRELTEAEINELWKTLKVSDDGKNSLEKKSPGKKSPGKKSPGKKSLGKDG